MSPYPVAAVRGKGGIYPSIPYYLRDQFLTNEAAPIVTPRTCEPGPNTLAIVDAGNNLSIAGNALACSGGSPTAISGTTVARALGGVAEVRDYTPTSGTIIFGIGRNDSNGDAFMVITGGGNDAIFGRLGGLNLTLATVVTAARRFVSLARPTIGSHLFVKISGLWKLLWPGNQLNTAALFSYTGYFTGVGVTDNLSVVKLSAPFDSDWGLATSYVAAPGAGATGVMAADGIVEATRTLGALESFELSVRYTDDNNRWCIRGSQGGSTIKIIEINAGAETERSSAAQTFTVGTPYRIVVICDGQSISTVVANTAKNSYALAAFNLTAAGIKVSHAVSNLAAWPVYPAAASIFDAI